MREEEITFGALLRRYRLRAGLTHEALAERAEVSAAAIAALERGRRHHPYPHTVSRLAEALDLSSEERTAFGALASARGAHAILPPPGIPRKAPAYNLPAPRTRLIGRERDVATLVELVPVHPGRLVTLTGVGGSGKTRLALRVADDLVEAFPDGVWLVDLSPTADPALVATAVAKSLGVPEAPGAPLIDTLTSWLRTQTLLIVLDNCEHVLDGCAQVVEPLLTACPGARILATSREPLQLAGERQWRVQPLAVPDPDQPASFEELAGFPAMQLVEDRAQAVDASFRLTTENAVTVAKICARLDGIPLALELAAAWARVLSVGQILERLDDSLRLLTGGSRVAPTRQQTLRATLDWSYDLLTEPERAMFRRLAVFAGGWTLGATEAVCAGDGIDAAEVLDLLTALVDKSLVVMDQQNELVRYRLLESVREYGLEQLKARGEEAATRRAHAEYYVAFAEAADLHSPAAGGWSHRLEADYANLHAVLVWSQEADEGADALLRLVAALGRFWHIQGHTGEGSAWSRASLALPEAAQHTELQAGALYSAGMLAWEQGDHAAARTFLEASVASRREITDRRGLAHALSILGAVLSDLGEMTAADDAIRESIAHFNDTGDAWGLGTSLHFLGTAAFRQGDLARARRCYEESIVQCRQAADTAMTAYVLRHLGYVAQTEGRHDEVLRHISESLVLNQAIHDLRGVAACVAALATLAVTQGQSALAARLSGLTAVLLKQAGATAVHPTDRPHHEHAVAAARAALGADAFTASWTEGDALTVDAALALTSACLVEAVGGWRPLDNGNGGPAATVAQVLTVARLPNRSESRGDAVPTESLTTPLTRREQEVARLLAQGYTDRQIADALTIAPSTVGTHVHHLLAKLGAQSRWQVADRAIERGLLRARPG